VEYFYNIIDIHTACRKASILKFLSRYPRGKGISLVGSRRQYVRGAQVKCCCSTNHFPLWIILFWCSQLRNKYSSGANAFQQINIVNAVRHEFGQPISAVLLADSSKSFLASLLPNGDLACKEPPLNGWVKLNISEIRNTYAV
jgi:hypothetical protein